MSKDVLLVTHAMFLSMTNRGDIADDFRVVIDEGLRSFEDIEIDTGRLANIQVFCRMAGNKASSSFLAHIDKMINDTNDGSAVVDRQETDYCKALIMLCMKKMQADVEKTDTFEHYENVLSVLRFMQKNRIRAAIKRRKSLVIRSVVKDMDLPNPILILDGSASVSRTQWKGFQIYRTTQPVKKFANTTLHVLMKNPTKTKLEENLEAIKQPFVNFIEEHPSYQAWMATNKPKEDEALRGINRLCDELQSYCPITLTRGKIVGSNLAKDQDTALIACSLFTDVCDYALSAALYTESNIEADRIWISQVNSEGRPFKAPNLGVNGFRDRAIQVEFQRQFTDELYQTIMRGVIRQDHSTRYDAFSVVPSLICLVELMRKLPGCKVVAINNNKKVDVFNKFKDNPAVAFKDIHPEFAKNKSTGGNHVVAAREIFAAVLSMKDIA